MKDNEWRKADENNTLRHSLSPPCCDIFPSASPSAIRCPPFAVISPSSQHPTLELRPHLLCQYPGLGLNAEASEVLA